MPWKKALVSQQATLLDAIKAINESQAQIALVVTDDQQLLGSVTDGDSRRAILAGYGLDTPVEKVMKRSPEVAAESESEQCLLSRMRARGVHQLPVTDKNGKLIGIHTLDELIAASAVPNEVVLMAGGLGRRLKQLTKNTPKPLLHIGDKPILETILENFVAYGFSHFTISLGYLGEMIQSYFGDGERWGVRIRYVQEEQPLGTAGALSLLPERPKERFFVMNGDVLTKVNFRQLMRFHREHQADATMCVRGFQHQVPYGVVESDGAMIQSIKEKPIENVMVNAGVYLLEPMVLDFIAPDQPLDMPNLFETLIAQQRHAAAFPIHEYWMDVGEPDKFEQADKEYTDHF